MTAAIGGGEELPPEVEAAIKEFNCSVDKVETVISGLIDKQFAEGVNKLDSLDQARAYLSMTYAMNSLFWMYLNTQGISTQDHPIKQELDRIRTYMNKVQALLDKRKAMKVDKEAAGRFIKSALREPKKRDTDITKSEKRKKSSVKKANKSRKSDDKK